MSTHVKYVLETIDDLGHWEPVKNIGGAEFRCEHEATQKAEYLMSRGGGMLFPTELRILKYTTTPEVSIITGFTPTSRMEEKIIKH